MKKEIMAYITALINVHQNSLEKMHDSLLKQSLIGHIDELNDLLDFVSDLKENESINVFLK